MHVLVDSGNMQLEVIQNMVSGAIGGAGIQAAQTIAGKGVKMLITGNVGPNAFQALSAAGIKIVARATTEVQQTRATGHSCTHSEARWRND